MAHSSLADGIFDFSVKLYCLLKEGDGNIFISPYSISAALLLTDLGARGKTDTEIRNALGVGGISNTDTHKQYKQLESQLKAETKGTTTVSIANRIFSKLDLEVDEEYQNKSNEYYDSGLELLDFIGDPEKSRNHINKWVEEQTRNKIKNLLPPGTIGPLSLLVLVNAIYFKGEWQYPFEGHSTRKSDFHLKVGNTTKVDMMNGEEKVKYVMDSSAGYSAVELPYKNCNVAMVIILPEAIDGLATLEKKLDSVLGDMMQKLKQANRPDVILGIPKFKMEAQYKLEKMLPQMGIVDMFDPKAADFSAMLPNTPDAYISEAVHKTFVEVNEKGTEAAAATAMVMMLGCALPLEPPKRFVADHPFIFLIRDTRTDTILFMGRYVSPPI